MNSTSSPTATTTSNSNNNKRSSRRLRRMLVTGLAAVALTTSGIAVATTDGTAAAAVAPASGTSFATCDPASGISLVDVFGTNAHYARVWQYNEAAGWFSPTLGWQWIGGDGGHYLLGTEYRQGPSAAYAIYLQYARWDGFRWHFAGEWVPVFGARSSWWCG